MRTSYNRIFALLAAVQVLFIILLFIIAFYIWSMLALQSPCQTGEGIIAGMPCREEE